jgi:glycosyltransferase involved in cell wall biosynthesis
VKVLIVSAQFPYPPRSGFATRVYQLALQLARRHEVTLVSYASADELEGAAQLADELSVVAVRREPVPLPARRAGQILSLASRTPSSCRAVRSRALQRQLDELCSAGRFDIVQLETSLLCAFTFPPQTRLVIDEHNVEYEVFARMAEGERSRVRRTFNRLEHARFRRFEQDCWRRADGCVVTSDRELPTVRAHAPATPVAVVPNGVDLQYFTPSEAATVPRTVVFNGILTYRPNVDAAHHLVEEIWPLVQARCPDARLRLMGRASEEDRQRFQRPGVEVLGEVPDVRPYIHEAAVVAVPVRIGGGTRLKVLEGLALGKAMVSTSLGCEGVGVQDGEHVMVGDDAATFAEHLLTLFEDSPLRGRLGSAGRLLVERDFSWELAGRRLEALLTEVAAESGEGSRAAAPKVTPGLGH